MEKFQQVVENSALKLSKDGCYSFKTCQEFSNYNLTSEAACDSFDLIFNFNGNTETFYPKFYKINSKIKIFPNLSKRSSVILGCEVANLVLAHLSNTDVKDNYVDFTVNTFTKKENSIIKYISEYVISSLYRRLYNCIQTVYRSRSKSALSQLGSQSLDPPCWKVFF